MSQGLPPAGWYPDRLDPSKVRWWDGTSWTSHTHPAAADAEMHTCGTRTLNAMPRQESSPGQIGGLTGCAATALGSDCWATSSWYRPRMPWRALHSEPRSGESV